MKKTLSVLLIVVVLGLNAFNVLGYETTKYQNETIEIIKSVNSEYYSLTGNWVIHYNDCDSILQNDLKVTKLTKNTYQVVNVMYNEKTCQYNLLAINNNGGFVIEIKNQENVYNYQIHSFLIKSLLSKNINVWYNENDFEDNCLKCWSLV